VLWCSGTRIKIGANKEQKRKMKMKKWKNEKKKNEKKKKKARGFLRSCWKKLEKAGKSWKLDKIAFYYFYFFDFFSFTFCPGLAPCILPLLSVKCNESEPFPILRFPEWPLSRGKKRKKKIWRDLVELGGKRKKRGALECLIIPTLNLASSKRFGLLLLQWGWEV